MATKSNSIKKKAFLAKMETTLGNITASCKAANIARSTYYEWMEKDPKFAAAVNELAEANIDFAESCLKQQIKDGNTTATIFYLKTKGKARGYIESHEIIGSQEAPVVLSFKDALQGVDTTITDDELYDDK
jgi:hypothetical protein